MFLKWMEQCEPTSVSTGANRAGSYSVQTNKPQEPSLVFRLQHVPDGLNVRVVGAELPLLNAQRPLQQRPSAVIIPLLQVQHRQICTETSRPAFGAGLHPTLIYRASRDAPDRERALTSCCRILGHAASDL